MLLREATLRVVQDVKIGDVEVEARSIGEVEALLKVAADVQTKAESADFAKRLE